MASVIEQIPFNEYTGNGLATEYAFEFELLQGSDLVVSIDRVVQPSSLYTVDGVGVQAGGSVTFTSAPADGADVLIERRIKLERATEYQNNGDLRSTVVNLDFKRLWQALQQQGAAQISGLRAPFPESLDVLPPAEQRLGMQLLFHPVTGQPYLAAPATGSIADILPQFAGTASAATGAGLSGFGADVPYAEGTAGRALQSRGVSPKDAPYNAKADGVTDDTAAINACLAAHLHVDFGGAENHYIANGVLNLRTGHTIKANGAEIWQTSDDTEIFNYEGKTDILVMGLKANGKSTDHSDSDSSRAAFMYGNGGAGITVAFCKLKGFSYTTVRAKNDNGVTFCHNRVEGPGEPILTPVTSGRCYGFLADAGCSNVHVFGNTITKTAQGVRLEQVTSWSVIDNDIHDITGQHGLYLGSGLLDGNADQNRIRDVDLCGIKVQAQDTATDNRRISISGNKIFSAGDQGILVCNGAGPAAATVKNRGITIEGNNVFNAGGSGINVQNTIGATIDDNTVDGAAFSGINLSACSRVTIGGENVIENTGLSGIRDESPCSSIVIDGVQIRDCATAATSGDRYGIFVQSMTNWTIRKTIISDDSAKMQYGIYCAGGDQTTLVLEFNQVLNATDHGLRVKNSTDSARIYRGNLWTGTTGPVFSEPPPPTVASASTITLPQGWDVVKISGTTGITSINAAGHSGRKVGLIFADALTVTDGGNLALAGNFTTTGNDMLTVACDGSIWTEAGRSIN